MTELQQNLLILFSLIMLIVNYFVVRVYFKEKNHLQEEIDDLNFEITELKSKRGSKEEELNS